MAKTHCEHYLVNVARFFRARVLTDTCGFTGWLFSVAYWAHGQHVVRSFSDPYFALAVGAEFNPASYYQGRVALAPPSKLSLDSSLPISLFLVAWACLAGASFVVLIMPKLVLRVYI
jgi:hypothetical protein